MLAFAACGGSIDGTDIPPGAPVEPAAPLADTPTVVTGKVVAPDGTTPIAAVLVYAESSGAPDDKLLVTPACGAPSDTTWPATCTAADGTFSLNTRLPIAKAKLVAKKGAFEERVDLTDGNPPTIALGNVLLSAATGSRIAVVTGAFDRIQDVLAKLGYGKVTGVGELELGTETFALFNGDGGLPGSYRTIDKLFVDGDADGRPDIYNYSVVFFNCGLSESLLTVAANREILRAYVQSGGRLYVSDLAYDYVEQVFPEFINFEGSASTAAGAPETPDVAQVGAADITVRATLDPALAAWLGTVTCGTGTSCLNTDGTATLAGFLPAWAVIDSAHATAPSAVRSWVSGPVIFGASSTPVVRPLTMSFGFGQGRVTYTSYHNEPQVSTGISPQERIMQFIVFEL